MHFGRHHHGYLGDKNIPVIMISNVYKKDIVDEAKSLGAVDFWEKTKVMPKELVWRVKEIIG